MKKFFSMMAVLAAMFAFASCEPTPDPGPEPTPETKKLATPVLSETHTETSFTVAWEAVTNAEQYIVNMDGKNFNTTECEYTFENLNAGEYTVRVQAKGTGYETSDPAKIVVTITGATSVDWFEQTLSKITEPVEVTDGYGDTFFVNGWDGFLYTWKGTGVSEIKAGIFSTEQIDGMTINDLKEYLSPAGQDIVSVVNSAEGYEGVITGCTGSTSYSVVVLVTNTDGVEFYTQNDITTDVAVATKEAVAWFGEWTCSTEQIFTFDKSKSLDQCFSNQTVEHTLNITQFEGYTDRLLVDGFSSMGTNTPAVGYLYEGENGENILALMNEAMIGYNQGYYDTWVSCGQFSDKSYNFMLGEFPVHMLVMDADGTVHAQSYMQTITYNQNGDTFAPMAFGVCAYDGNTQIAFYEDENKQIFPFYAGAMKNVAKKSATPSMASVRSMKTRSLSSFVATSMVYSL